MKIKKIKINCPENKSAAQKCFVKTGCSERALFFSIDGLVALLIILFGLLLISQSYFYEKPRMSLEYASSDLIGILSEAKISEINNSYANELISNGTIKEYELNNSVLEVIGKLWVSNKREEAKNLFRNITFGLIPNDFGFGIYLNNNPIYERNSTSNKEVIAYSRMISGIEEEKPVEGYTAKAFINSIEGSYSYSYAFFGGLVGQGNITKYIMMPSSFNVSYAYMQLDVGNNFTLYINGNYSGHYVEGCSGGGFMRAYTCVINESYYSNFIPGLNELRFAFDSQNNSYIAGGLFSVKYFTQETNFSESTYNAETNTSTRTEYLPGVSSIINVYSSFYVPGNLTSLEFFLNFSTDYPIFMKIGNLTVYDGMINNATGDLAVNLTDDILYALNYSFISEKTVPYRIGHYEFNESNITGQGHNADVVLITDLSGSMRWRIGDWLEIPGNARTCDNPDLYHKNDTRRVSVAKCLDIEFVNVIMNFSGNRLWLVDFNDAANYYYSTSKDLLINRIKNYPNNPTGGTCICCAINLAYEILNNYSGPSRTKFVVVMSDGIPNYCCGRYWQGWFWRCNTTGTSTTGLYIPYGCDGSSDDCESNDCNSAINSSINAAARVHNNLNATLYSIAFGPMLNCSAANQTLFEIARVGNGSYYGSKNASELLEIYRDIANQINNKSITFEYQKVNAVGVHSQLHPNSYIKMSYNPKTPPISYGTMPLTIESNNFGNFISQGNFYMPPNTSVSEAKAISFSSYYWTDNLTINNRQAFRLSEFNSNYLLLGDPFIVYIPLPEIIEGNNSVIVSTGYSPTNNTGGSPDNKVIYTLLTRNFVSYSATEKNADGCTWIIYFEDESNATLKTPVNYSGEDYCIYNATASGTNCIYNSSYQTDDAIEKAFCELLSLLDPDKDGKLNIKISQSSFNFEIVVISKVPSLWGPAILRIAVWK
ncbi:MAG: vWA domain-containing protein [Candidatus Woesearchaeota archaeon]